MGMINLQKNFIGIAIGNGLTLFLGIWSSALLASKFGLSTETEELFIFLICGVAAPSMIGSTVTTVIGKNITKYWNGSHKSKRIQLQIVMVLVSNAIMTYLIFLIANKTTDSEIQNRWPELITFSSFQLIVLFLQSILFAVHRNLYSTGSGAIIPIVVIILLTTSPSIDSVIIGQIAGIVLQTLILLLYSLKYLPKDIYYKNELSSLTLPLTLNIIQNIVISLFNFGARKSLAGIQGNSLSIYSVAEKVPLSIHNLTSNSIGLEILYFDESFRARIRSQLRERLDLVHSFTALLFLTFYFAGPMLFTHIFVQGKFTESNLVAVLEVVILLVLGNIINGFNAILNGFMYSTGQSNFLSLLGLIQFTFMFCVLTIVERLQSPTGLASLLFVGALLGSFIRVFLGTRRLGTDFQQMFKFCFYKMILTLLLAGALVLGNISDISKVMLSLAIIIVHLLTSRPYNLLRVNNLRKSGLNI